MCMLGMQKSGQTKRWLEIGPSRGCKGWATGSGQDRGVKVTPTFLAGWTAVPVTEWEWEALEENWPVSFLVFVFRRERFGRTQKFSFGDIKFKFGNIFEMGKRDVWEEYD